MNADLATMWELVEAGDVPAVLRQLRFNAEQLAVADLARIIERAAAQLDFDDLTHASSALAARPDHPQALYDFGYACIERGAPYLAIPALTAALRAVPDSPAVLLELIAALEDENRHGTAVDLLAEREATLRAWPERYLLVFNALMAGDLTRAAQNFGRLPVPEDDQWQPAHERVRRMLNRAALARDVTPLDRQDLRGWHYVVAGTILGTLSPHGFAEGMTGRYAYLRDHFGLCRYGLHRLRLALATAGRRPRTVSLLPDRSSQILGLAAAEFLCVPAEPFAPGRPETVVVAYDLRQADGELADRLRDRIPGQVVYEHATCWTEPPAVTADITAFLVQTVVPPWGGRLLARPDGSGVEHAPADDRTVAELATDILAADATPDAGDGKTPPDSDQVLAGFVAGVQDRWLIGPRDRVRSPGPVPSSRFR